MKKEAEISTCLGWCLGAEKPKEYFVFDLNCGPGENRTNGANCLGTGPLTRDKLKKLNITAHMFLCDISKRHIKQAERKFFSPQLNLFEQMGSAVFVRMDNRLFVPTIPERIIECGGDPRTAHGIIIADPDGLHVPLAEIAECLDKCPLLNVAIHLCGLKRVASCRVKRPDMPQMNLRDTTVRSLNQVFTTVRRNSWLVSEEYGGTTRGSGGHFILYGSHLPWLKEIIDMEGRPNMWSIWSPKGKVIISEADCIAEVA